jgi:hypothetical protein
MSKEASCASRELRGPPGLPGLSSFGRSRDFSHNRSRVKLVVHAELLRHELEVAQAHPAFICRNCALLCLRQSGVPAGFVLSIKASKLALLATRRRHGAEQPPLSGLQRHARNGVSQGEKAGDRSSVDVHREETASSRAEAAFGGQRFRTMCCALEQHQNLHTLEYSLWSPR